MISSLVDSKAVPPLKHCSRCPASLCDNLTNAYNYICRLIYVSCKVSNAKDHCLHSTM
ncbi:hypothetical protein WN48_03150 [Eufriesea mexicana]|uniref:Uncharacterized protein n=1 Tax=Eufriesea mexicana TaxID=516756 RepID=A0A310SJR6_9HYME|nr:hypothetical protein WN48_03150 [Eufriesea mexicana]